MSRAAAASAPAAGLSPGAGVEAIRSLYVHVPFCERKCEYCDFASIAGLRGHREYVAALRAELRGIAAALPGVTLDTVFVGGGTPGLLPPELLAAVMAEITAGFGIAPGAELTVEANPSSTSEARAAAWLDAGFTRVSLGVQSLDPAVLRFLGRVHGPERALEALGEVRRAGFTRVNADLIHSVPGLDDATWRATVERVLAADPGHLSCYELTVEEGTPLATWVRSGAVEVVDAETALRQHWIAVDLAAAAGYVQYEVSNLARPGQECRHNLAYWHNRPYLAAGVGAHGHLPPPAAIALGFDVEPDAAAVRYWHSREPADYVAALSIRGSPAAAASGFEAVTRQAAELERVMVGLRLTEGLRVDHPTMRARAAELVAAGLLENVGGLFRATRRGQEVLDRNVLALVHDL
jgi:oxygen-independent coproporphyrinogen-3 oxidase